MKQSDSTWFESRMTPETVGFQAGLTHGTGWAALSITGSPQVAEITLTNRMPQRVLGALAEVTVVFRPGVLIGIETIALAPQSEAEWVLSSETRDGHVLLHLRASLPAEIAPGETLAIRLVGVSVAPGGGSRSTRVEIAYSGFFLPAPEDTPPTEVIGVAHLGLPLLRRHAPEPVRSLPERASTALADPFFAGVRTGRTLLNDGLSPNHVSIRLLNVSGHPVRLSGNEDEATRLTLVWRTGSKDGNWGLLGRLGSHLTLLSEPDGWIEDRYHLRCQWDRTLPPGGYIDLELEIHTNALDGEAELGILVENLPDHDDGRLSLPFDLAPIAPGKDSVEITKPLSLRGHDAAIRFHPGELGVPDVDANAPSLKVNRSDAYGKLEIDAPLGLSIGTQSNLSIDAGLIASVTATKAKLSTHADLSLVAGTNLSMTASAAIILKSPNTIALEAGNGLSVEGEATFTQGITADNVTAKTVNISDHPGHNRLHFPNGWYLDVSTGGHQFQIRKDHEIIWSVTSN